MSKTELWCWVITISLISKSHNTAWEGQALIIWYNNKRLHYILRTPRYNIRSNVTQNSITNGVSKSSCNIMAHFRYFWLNHKEGGRRLSLPTFEQNFGCKRHELTKLIDWWITTLIAATYLQLLCTFYDIAQRVLAFIYHLFLKFYEHSKTDKK